jgi:hypothetical protein
VKTRTKTGGPLQVPVSTIGHQKPTRYGQTYPGCHSSSYRNVHPAGLQSPNHIMQQPVLHDKHAMRRRKRRAVVWDAGLNEDSSEVAAHLRCLHWADIDGFRVQLSHIPQGLYLQHMRRRLWHLATLADFFCKPTAKAKPRPSRHHN